MLLIRLHSISINMLRRKVFGNPKPDNSNKRPRMSSENENLEESSKYFSTTSSDATQPINIAEKIIELQKKLTENLKTLNLLSDQIHYIYNPLEYASEPNENFTRKYCTTLKKILFLGINPGPNGMCQTGVPFGDSKWVTDWLKVEGYVFKPSIECPERQIYGLSCPKGEPSGDRLWNFFSRICISPENFFKHSFVFNFCPVAFMDAKGRNVTPDEFIDTKVPFSIDNWVFVTRF